MNQQDLAGNISSFREVSRAAITHVNDGHMLYRGECRRPRDGDAANAKLDLGNLSKLRIEGSAGGADHHLRSALRPGIRNGEFFRMDAIGVGSLKGLHAPVDGPLHCRLARHTATDFIRQPAQVAFNRGRLEGSLHNNGRIVRMGGRNRGKTDCAQEKAKP